jgi:hypothetical protein
MAEEVAEGGKLDIVMVSTIVMNFSDAVDSCKESFLLLIE